MADTDKLVLSKLETPDIRVLRRAFFGIYFVGFSMSVLISILSIPISFLPDRRGKLHLPVSIEDSFGRMLDTFLETLIFFFIISFFLSSKILLDLITQRKLSGNAIIIRKWVSKKTHYLQLNTTKKITVKKAVFDSLVEGNRITIAMAKHSKYIFKLEKTA